MIEKQKTIENLEITEDNTVIIRERVAIIEDGEEISHKFEQHNIQPGDDYSKEDDRVKAVCGAVKEYHVAHGPVGVEK